MKATVTPINRRISFQLDVAIVCEALILKRLEQTPKSRKEDWLRGLLVQGFQRECREHRKIQGMDQASRDTTVLPSISTTPSVAAAAQPKVTPAPNTKPRSEATETNAQRSDNIVSFARLRKVIG